jgi:PAS domain S-box-containing protein
VSRTARSVLLAIFPVALVIWWFSPELLSTDTFMPHGHCYLWKPSMVRLHVSSDAVTGFSYVSISATLAYVVKKREDLPFHWMFLAFGLFIIACGATHFMEIWTLWTPVYWLSGTVKLITAAASLTTALLLPPLVPKILGLPSPSLLTKANTELESEIAERRRQDASLREQAQLLDLASDTIVVRELGGAVTFWNRAAEAMYGWTRDEALGKALHALLKTDTPSSLEQIEEALVKEGRWEGEIVQTRRDGARLVIASRWALQRDTEGEPRSVLEINRDVTDQKHLEEQRGELARERAAMQEEVIQRQREQLHEMATPFIPITDRIMVMPLIGTIDSDRARQVMETALVGSASRSAKVVILDVTGMTHLDTGVASALMSTARALSLLGTRMILTGIRPELAQTLVSAGVDLGGIVTSSTLQSGIAYAMSQTDRALGAAR